MYGCRSGTRDLETASGLNSSRDDAVKAEGPSPVPSFPLLVKNSSKILERGFGPARK